MACEKSHSETDKIVKDLPVNQGGIGRHKCASCAYEQGFQNGKEHKEDFSVNDFISSLPISQKGLRRHKDPIVAYELGFYHGQECAIENLTIKDKKSIAFKMKHFGLSMVAKGVLSVFSEEGDIPYSHATGIIHIAHGFEILIKARIVEEHPLLIFEKILRNEKIKESELEFNDILNNGHTIDYKKLPYQLWATTGYKIENQDLYKEFGNIRNQIIHFSIPKNIILPEKAIRYAFELVEKATNEWWNKSIFGHIKTNDNNVFKKLFEQIEELNISVNYKFDETDGFKENENL